MRTALPGREDRETVYGDDPAAMALRWQRGGGPVSPRGGPGRRVRGRAAEPARARGDPREVSACCDPVEFGGGLRSMEAMALCSSSGSIGSSSAPPQSATGKLLRAAAAEFGRQVFVGLDARDGLVAVDGWKSDSGVRASDMLGQVEDDGAGGVIYTDVADRWRALRPEFRGRGEILAAARVPVIASGGVATSSSTCGVSRGSAGRSYRRHRRRRPLYSRRPETRRRDRIGGLGPGSGRGKSRGEGAHEARQADHSLSRCH